MPGAGLIAALDRLASRHVPGAELGALREELRRRYGPALRGILFYGSCLRSGNAGRARQSRVTTPCPRACRSSPLARSSAA